MFSTRLDRRGFVGRRVEQSEIQITDCIVVACGTLIGCRGCYQGCRRGRYVGLVG